MGLYHLHVRPGKTESVLELVKTSGVDFIRVATDAYGTHYFFKHPKQKREIVITIWKDEVGEEYIRMGVASVNQALAKMFTDADLLIPFEFKNADEQDDAANP